MIKPACLQAGRLLERRAAGLGPAAALTLEEHIASCSACGRDAQLLAGLTLLNDAGAATLPMAARNRIVRAAFARQVHAEEPSQPHARSWQPWLGGAFAAVAALVMLASGLGSEWPRLAPWFGTNSATDQLVSGQLAADGVPVARGVPLARNADLETTLGALVTLAHADVQLRPGTRADWDAAARVVRLRSGSLLAEVDPARKQSFTVTTERLRVKVLGTRFEVAAASVRVLRGRVQVSTAEGRELAVLSAGESYSLPQTAATTAARQKTTTTPVAPVTDSAATDHEPNAVLAQRGARPSAERPRGRTVTTEAAAPPQDTLPARAAVLLDQARAELAGRRVAAARTLIETVLKAQLRPAERAEALSLRADCFLVEHDPAAAARAYQKVAEEFAQLPAGENALFAAARLEAERGAQAAAKALFERYLERYPHGRFVKEVNTRLVHPPSPAPTR